MANASGKTFQTIILGAGAAGLFCAGSLKNGALVLDHNASAGKKLLLSGGGKCNFSNVHIAPEKYASNNPAFCRSALAKFDSENFLTLLRQKKIPWETRPTGQLFARSAREILQMLLARLRENCSQCLFNCGIQNIEREKGMFFLDTSLGKFSSPTIVLATGGLSFPSTGASDFAFRLAKKWGLKIIQPRPALVGLVFDSALQEKFSSLAGLSFDGQLTIQKRSFRGPILFTHKGIGGPATYQASLFWQANQPITIDFLPQNREECFGSAQQFLSNLLPHRLAQILAKDFSAKQLSRVDRLRFFESVHRFTFLPTSTTGFGRAEVTAGGIDTREISSKTFEAEKVDGLYIVGEALDMTGALGGYNLHWAWASAQAAATAIARKSADS